MIDQNLAEIEALKGHEDRRDYDVVVLGAGAAGIEAALHAAKHGFTTLLVTAEFGGQYLNGGTVEARFLFENARLIRNCMGARRGRGIVIDKLSLNMKQMMAEKDRVVKQTATELRQKLDDAGVRTILGAGRPLPNHSIDVSDNVGDVTRYQYKTLIIATGSKTKPQDMLESFDVISDKNIFSLSQIPRELTIMGNGPKVCEVASIYATMGSRVSIINHDATLLRGLDVQIIGRLEEQMKRSGIKIYNRVQPVDMYRDSLGTIHIELASVGAETPRGASRPKTEETVISTAIYQADDYVGNLAGLDALRLDIDENKIVTDSYGKTSVDDVYAVGDVTGKSEMAYEGQAMARMVVDNIAAKRDGKPLVNMQAYKVPKCIHSFPEVASIGLGTKEVNAEDEDIRFGLAPLGSEPGSLFATEKQGFVKVIVDGKYHEVLGVHIIGENACELIAQAQVLMALEGTVDDMEHIIRPMPGLSQALLDAFGKTVD